MVAKLFIWCIRAYQYFLSPLFPPACRFFPNCSTYAMLAVERYGLWKGMGLALWRIVRCNPFHPGGVDLLD